jgi:predicted pyridoxine 5'-phosphate oxidase superfamily flavin-nucleotide-binding protein
LSAQRTIAFADFSGNKQYITLGNLADNPKGHLFLIDYARCPKFRFQPKNLMKG